MRVSYNWLNEYVQSGWSPAEVASALTMSGLEVEEVETIGTPLDGVVVGHVVDTRRHPNADRLTLCSVEAGGPRVLEIVCGAPNVAPGQKVPVALVGTTLSLPDKKDPFRRVPVTLERRAVRGVVSEGMICAEDELGLSDDHSGIMVLRENATVGQAFGEYLASEGREVHDAVLDVNITPNRPDAAGHIGMARDIAALSGRRLRTPDVPVPPVTGRLNREVTIDIQAPEGCPRYVAMLVRNVKVGESPEWLKRRLTAVGLRPRNNVVDVTNFVMYECGQPLHAFDFDRIAGARIIVRHSGPEERFTTLDGKERSLPSGALLIADGERPVAIAGVMGGENSEVTGETRNVLIESACFEPSSIRRTVKALGLQTDSSYRFERGVDPEGQVWAAARAARLIASLAGGEVLEDFIDEHPRPSEPRTAPLRVSRLHRILGARIPLEEARRLLTAIGFEVAEARPLDLIAEQVMEGRNPEVPFEEQTLLCTIPSFRPDVEREIDIIEEVARLYGFDKIAEPAHVPVPAIITRETPEDILRSRARSLLSGTGFRETYTNSMLRRETAEWFAGTAFEGSEGAVVETLNPISAEMSALRPSMLPGLLQVVHYNQNRGQRILRFFEFGHVFQRTPRPDALVPGFAEHESLILVASGLRREAGWDASPETTDLYDLKGALQLLFTRLQLADHLEMKPFQANERVASSALSVRIGGRHAGIAAAVSGEVAREYDLKQPAFFAEINWSEVVPLAAPYLIPRYQNISRHPAVERDLAVIVPKEQAVGLLLDVVRSTGNPLLRRATVFDIYEGTGVEEGKKSVALSLRFIADRTLLDEEVDHCIEKILGALQQEAGAVLR